MIIAPAPIPNYYLYENAINAAIKRRSDRLMDFFLAGYFVLSLAFAGFYDTWFMATSISTLALTAYYTVKILLPDSLLYQYVLSAVLGIFMAQFIYQMHGMFEMHFFAFIGSAILITYQNWKLQLPMLIVVGIHHALFSYLQNSGVSGIFFTRLDYFDFQTFVVHILLTITIFFVSGLWAYQLKTASDQQIKQTLEMQRLQQEILLNQERKDNQEKLEQLNKDLLSFNHQLEKSRQEAQDANQAKSVFLATMSHEIRTPMNGVIGMATLLGETELNEQQRLYTETITNCGENLLTVINNILDFSKIEAGAMELERDDLHIRAAIEEVLDIFSFRIAGNDIEIVYYIEDNVPQQIIGDKVKLQQVLINLVGNALKFTSEGEVVIYVKLVAMIDNEQLIVGFDIKDTGIGIPLEKQKRLFKAFSQVDSSTTRNYGGTGLGLVISQKLVELMGGKISVSSNAQGSVFSFTIHTRAGNKLLEPYLQYEVTAHAGKKILVVDDNLTNRNILEIQLRNWKLLPTLVASGEEAINEFKLNKYDLLLTDAQMPQMDGMELAKKVKTLYPSLPIILLSSIGDEKSLFNLQLFNYILTKPIKQHALNKYITLSLNTVQPATAGIQLNSKIPEDLFLVYPMKILIAEDNLINQKVILHVLNKMGYIADMAGNGSEAVALFTKNHYDLIFMDMQMPLMDGLAATQQIRTLGGKQPIIVALTANALKADKETCMNAGMDDHLGKPLNVDELIAMLKKWHAALK